MPINIEKEFSYIWLNSPNAFLFFTNKTTEEDRIRIDKENTRNMLMKIACAIHNLKIYYKNYE